MQYNKEMYVGSDSCSQSLLYPLSFPLSKSAAVIQSIYRSSYVYPSGELVLYLILLVCCLYIYYYLTAIRYLRPVLFPSGAGPSQPGHEQHLL